MGELLSALQVSKVTNTLGQDGITHAALRNLLEQHKTRLPSWINQVWETAELPAEWKKLWVVPIPKSGETLHLVGKSWSDFAHIKRLQTCRKVGTGAIAIAV